MSALAMLNYMRLLHPVNVLRFDWVMPSAPSRK